MLTLLSGKKGRLTALLAALALILGGSLMNIPFAHADTTPSGSSSVVYVNGSAGDDSQAGDSAASAVKTFEKALALASANATIIVLDTVSVPSGTYDLKGLTIERGEGNVNALLAIDSADVTLNGSGAKVDGKGASADAPLIAATSSTVNMSGLTVTGGHNSNDPRRGATKEETIPADSWVSLGGGLGAKSSTINIENTTFTGNQATLGGAVFADGSTVNVKSGAKFDANEAKWDKASEHPDTKTYRADTTLPNGRALYAEGHAAGGAIMATSVYGVSTINVEDGAAFTNNVAPSGGAIATGRTEVGFGDKDDIQQYAMNTGGNTQVNITGGDFTGNTVKSAGGALFIQSNSTATVTGGKFTNNHADGIETQFSGGAIYVQDKKTQSYGHVYDIQIDQPGKLILKNALLTGNKAGEFGGALALCSTAEGYVAASEGAAIFDNTMDRVWWKKAGDTPTAIPSDHDDIVLFIKERGQIVSVSDYAIGNVVNDWDVIRGGTTQGFVGEEDGINAGMMTVHNDPYFLGNTLSDADKAAARANARVIFENNSTNSNGGALSINGIVEIGSPVGAFYIKKVDEENGEALGGAQFQLTGPNGFIKTVTLPTQDEYVRGNIGARKGVSAFRDLMPGEYTLTETKAPEGYPEHRSTWKISVGNQDDGYPIVITDEEGNEIASSDSVSEVGGELVIDVYNLANNKKDEERHPVEFSKQEFGDDTKELPGAEIKIYDKDGNVVEEFTSTDESHKMNLEAGEYTFEEVNAPEGFDKITTTVKFTVDAEGKVTVTNAEEVTDGKVSVKDVNHLILEDMPKKFPVEFSKQEFGDDTKELPGAEIKIYDKDGNVVEEFTSTDESHKMELRAGEYTFEEVNAPADFDKITTTVKFTVGTDGKVTVTNAEEVTDGKVSVVDTNHLVLEDMPKLTPAIEKYVNKDVHADIVEFDRHFTYDVMTLVTRDAHSVEIYDTLVDNLEFADKDGNPTTDASAAVLSVVAKDSNNHKAGGTVSLTNGTPVTGYTATITGNKLTVTIADASAVRGKWVQVTFNARIIDDKRSLAGLDQSTITEDTPVKSELDLPSGNKAGSHTGVPNTASYMEFDNAGNALEYFVDDKGNEKPKESNTVTVVPEAIQVDITKTWLNAEGWEQAAPAEWPAGATVTVDIMNGSEVVRTVELNADNQSATVTDLPKLVDATYSVVEREVEGVFALSDETKVTADDNGNLTAELVNRLLPVRSELLIEVAKVDEKGAALAGAELEVTNAEGAVVDSWTTDDANHLLPHIVPGKYTLTEKTAPTGYRIADPIKFEVKDDGTLWVNGKRADSVVITMIDGVDTGKTPGPKDSKSATPTKPNMKSRSLVNTGSPAGIAVLTAFALLGVGAGALAIRKRRS